MHPYDGRVVSNFIRQAIVGEPITLYGDGSQTRSFCFVDDLLDGMMAMMAHADFCGPVNIGNPDEFTIRQLAEAVVRLTGGNARIVQSRELPPDDPLQRRPDLTVAKAKLGFAPKIKLEEGLKRTIEYFRSIDLGKFRPPTPNY
jgi:UDP-glucuronate decarboxylase